jgi:serine protease
MTRRIEFGAFSVVLVALLCGLLVGLPGCPAAGGGGAVDSDGDGFSDQAEIDGRPGTDPNDATDNPNNVRDSDGDGCSDFDESNFANFCDNNPNTNPGDVVAPPNGGSVTVSGTISVGPTQLVDSDTNDPTNTFTDNDNIADAQDLPNPCTLGGYLGNTQGGRDIADVYRVQMAAGQTATLLLANPDTNDFDLALFDLEGNPLDSSQGVGKAEQVTAADNGTFLVQVFGFSVEQSGDNGGLYTLLIGQSPLGVSSLSAIARDRLSSLNEFVEGELIVKYKPGVSSLAQTSEGRGLTVVHSGETLLGFEVLRMDPPDKDAASRLRRTAPAATDVLRPVYSDTIIEVKRMRRRGDIEHAQPNYIRRVTAVPNDEFYNLQWHYPQINLPDAWDVTTGSPNVIVAVIDTGVDVDHPDLQGQLVAGYDFISDPNSSRDGDGIDSNADDPGDLGIQGRQSTFHGTHVAGTVAAKSNNGIGVAGVAWDTRIMPVRVLGQGGGTDVDIAQGILFAAGLANDSGTVPAQAADIINMSLGGQGVSMVEQQAITAARQAGTIVIVAAGNEQANSDFFSPAGLDGVVTVSAVDFDRRLAPYSNFGGSIDVAGPGGDVTRDANSDTFGDGVLSSLGVDGGGFTYDFSQGTSMACPHVAGVAALMKAVNPNLTPNDFDLLLAGQHPNTSTSITDDLGASGKDQSFGHGLINALKAVRAAGEIAGTSSVDSPVILVRPRGISFGASEGSMPVNVTNGGVGTLSVTSATASESWLSVSPTSGGAEAYTVSVNRGGLADGVYTGSVTFASNGGSATVTVGLNVGQSAASGGNVGTIFALLVNPTTLESVAQANLTAANGYAFSMENVPPGDYTLFAGTDMDNDSFIDNGGEAVGGYPTLRTPVSLDARQDRTGLNFAVSYSVNIQSPQASSAGAGGVAVTVGDGVRGRLRRMDIGSAGQR